uniref:UBC core domain-containing protein n=1 Tax=Euplotes harpa TaxID=151035 RepID=A0A7S3J8U2_9SPIT|mmetsp:Transcript_26099/g.30128  ORF Transcript_26099/g.30128 Transcript_26099/m.30128 type:complete len:148 (+) Transcript_26099:22-465(+)
MSARRINREIKSYIDLGYDNVCLDFSDNLYELHGFIIGPLGSVYEGSVLYYKLDLPKDYPFKPPKFKFLSKVFNPNVSSDGTISLAVLMDQWTPLYSIMDVVQYVVSILITPEKNILNEEAASLYYYDYEEFIRVAKDTMQLESDSY